MTVRRKRRLASEINVVPYIDVMLVLLVIFMVTAPLLTSGVDVDLPKAPAKPLDFSKQNQPLVLTVDRGGKFYLNVGEHPSEPLSPQQVKRTAAKIMRARPDAPIGVKGAGNSAYANVVRGMVLLQGAGAKHIGLLTDDVDTKNNTRSTQANRTDDTD